MEKEIVSTLCERNFYFSFPYLINFCENYKILILYNMDIVLKEMEIFFFPIFRKIETREKNFFFFIYLDLYLW